MDRAVFIHNTLRDFVSHFCFRVADDNIIVCHEECIANFTLCAERLAGAGGAQNQTVGVLQLFAVNHNQIVGQSIQAIIQAFFAVVEQFLCGKRHKNRCAAGGQTALDLNLAVCQRQRGHKPLLLLEIQPAQIAVVLLGDGAGLKDIVFQLLLRAPSVQHQKSDEEHPLVLALQLFEQSFRIPSVSCQIRRNDVNIIPGPDGFFLVE